MTWDEYYDQFYDWAESTQISKMSQLTSFGPSDEVYEIAMCFNDEKVVSRLIRKAISAGVKFTADEIQELVYCVSDDVIPTLVRSNRTPYTEEILDGLHSLIDDELLHELAKKSRLDYDNSDDLLVDEPEPFSPRHKNPGFFSTLFAVLDGLSLTNNNSHTHNGICTGDCATCPPHYGYRYGRWYYGRGHVYGCEFGGNKGDGSL